MDLTWDGNAVIPTISQQADGYVMTYDATMKPVCPPPNPNGPIAWNLQGHQSFHVGPVPVQATVTMHVNGKLVNGGGDASQPTTDFSWSSSLYYDLDGNDIVNTGDVPVPAFDLNVNTTLVGNGLTVIDDTQTMATSFILAPEYDYLLRYRQYLSISDLPSVPMTSTFEAGAETAYSGITLSLDATPVPEPTILSLLALAGTALLARRRR